MLDLQYEYLFAIYYSILIYVIINENRIKLLWGLTTEITIKTIVLPNRENATKRFSFLNSE